MKKKIPQMILAGSSFDDIFVIVTFYAVLSFIISGSGFISLVNIPISIILGLAIGVLIGFILYKIFQKIILDDTLRVIFMLATSFFLKYLESLFAYSSLLAIMTFSCVLFLKFKNVSKISGKVSSLWTFFSIMLFVLIGSKLDINYALDAGLKVIAIIFIALSIRSIGTYISVLPTNLNRKEKLFVIISYFPKATVQAAIGAIALENNLAIGSLTLTISVVAILLTAPLGTFLMDLLAPRLLDKK